MTSGVPWLLDLRSLQRRPPDSASADLDAEVLARLLAQAPAVLADPAGVALLDADPAWATTPSAAVLMRWLEGRRRRLCWTPWLSDIARDVLQLWHSPTRLCTPRPQEGRWIWEELAPAPAVQQSSVPSPPGDDRERLAYISPLPPQRSGISDYSLALLPALAEHFQIDVVACDPAVIAAPTGATALLNLEQFRRQRHTYQHLLYQLGNSTNHLEMVALLEEHPGAVVLHDFYLSHGLCSWEAEQRLGSSSAHRLYRDHGYRAWLDWDHGQRQDSDAAIWAYPCNLTPLRRASGVIVHSQEARRLADRFFGSEAATDWTVIPHLKQLAPVADRPAQRAALGFGAQTFVVCSFGFIGRSKLSAPLLEAFLTSELAADPDCALVLAGSVGGDRELKAQLEQLLRRARAQGGLRAEVRITGWIDTATYQAYQAAADAAVQLRTSSRGESSGTVLDCLAAGIPLIYNAHGSLAELPQDCGLRLPEECSIADLRRALGQLRADPELRRALARRGLALVSEQHRPDHCAALYAAAIRRANAAVARRQAVAELVRAAIGADPGERERRLPEAATGLALLLPPEPSQRQLFLDVSALAEQDLSSGVQRVVRAIGEQLLTRPPRGWRVEPVRASRDGLGYMYARGFTAALLGLGEPFLADGPLLPRQGDLFLGIDLHHDGVLRQAAYLQLLRAQGVAVHFVVHDLLPCQLPECFPPGAAELHSAWLQVVAACDGALGVSRSVAEELRGWLVDHPPPGGREGFAIGWFHHGCDFHGGGGSASSAAAPAAAGAGPAAALPPGPTLLMVGTVEPRKGYLDVIEAVSLLWQRGMAFNLVIVGREGWTDLPPGQRRSIPRTVAAIRRHPQLGRRLFWFEAASDAELDRLYRRADGLIGASYGEGFGIPLIEAASYGLPLLVRDLPVFQEVTQGSAVFFPAAADRDQLAAAIAGFLGRLADPGSAAALRGMLEPQSWRQSADQLLRALGLEPAQPADPLHREAPAKADGSTVPEREPLANPGPLGRRQKLRRQLGRLRRRLRGAWPQTVQGRPTGPIPSPEIGEAAAWLQDLAPPGTSQPNSMR
jgi:glycosyltransferase involved in cell wall biosynthesis